MDYRTADRLIELRRKNGYSQEELADRLDVSRQAVSKWERAESLPDTENLIALARLYGVTLDELVNGEKANAGGAPPQKSDGYVIHISVDRKKALNIISLVMLAVGILFVLVGTGFFLGFSVPETRDLGIARNESIAPVDAQVTKTERTSIRVSFETMYRIVFEWPDGSGKSNAVYYKEEAEAMIGETVAIRIDDGRAVLVDYQRSGLSVIGFVFIGVFGGLGVSFIGVFALLFVLNRKQKDKE